MNRLRHTLRLLRLRGVGYLRYLAVGYLIPRLSGWMLFESRFSRWPRRLASGLARLGPRPSAESRGGGERSGRRFHSARGWLPETTRRTALDRDDRNGHVVLGRIDNDGRVLALRGPLPGWDQIGATEFVERYRYGLDLVLEGDAILIRKDFRGDREAFLREWQSLECLDGAAGSPAVHHVEEKCLRLYKGFVPGPTLRQCLVDAGARILSVETEADPTLAGLDPAARIEAVWARGREHFETALVPGLLRALERKLDAIHSRGVTGFSLSFGNVVVHERTGEPCFIDFDAARTHRRASGFAFAVDRDRDRDLFNRIYGRDLLTERSARGLMERVSSTYSPVDLGRGLASRGFWSVDSGTGRWELLNRQALTGMIEGQRILDLGSYNGLMPLLMLAQGARRVVAVEKSPALVATAGDLRRLFEWRDARSYDLKMRCADMRTILDGHWETFDLVTAFCSLYYLSERDMGRVVRRAAELAPVLVVQAKTDTRAAACDNKAEKSSLPFLHALLERCGFPRVDVVAPPGYSRPLLIGRRGKPDRG